MEQTLDRFLGGRIVAAQPAYGFRAGHDSVLLAAAVPDQVGARILELGSGAGIASLCFAARARQSALEGIEIDPDLVSIAAGNAERNGFAHRLRFVCGDVMDEPSGVFDHAFFNPPFYSRRGTPSPVTALNVAKRDPGNAVSAWTDVAVRSVRAGGTVTAILALDRVKDMLAGVQEHAAVVFPLYTRDGAKPKRAVIRIHPGTRGEHQTLRGLVLHRANGSNTEEAEAILRYAFPLVMG